MIEKIVSTPFNAINRVAPYESYNYTNIASYFKTVDEMAKYPNTLGLLVADELVMDQSSFSSAPVIKAVVRDLKKYMNLKHKATKQRVLPIGYNVGSIVGPTSSMLLSYLAGGDSESSVDFWAVSSAPEEGQKSPANLFNR